MKICEYKKNGEMVATLHATIEESYVETHLVFENGEIQTEYHPKYPASKSIMECFLFCIYYLVIRNDGVSKGVMTGTPLKAIDRLGHALGASVFINTEKGADVVLLELK